MIYLNTFLGIGCFLQFFSKGQLMFAISFESQVKNEITSLI